jgi:hypothetical protein
MVGLVLLAVKVYHTSYLVVPPQVVAGFSLPVVVSVALFTVPLTGVHVVEDVKTVGALQRLFTGACAFKELVQKKKSKTEITLGKVRNKERHFMRNNGFSDWIEH